MSDIVDQMIDGTLCNGCGVYLGGAQGYPKWCRACQKTHRADALRTAAHVHHRDNKINCPQCNKRVKIVGLAQHIKDAHT